MTALANSLKRMWAARNRVPHPTRWGADGCVKPCGKRGWLDQLVEVYHQKLPAIICLTLSLLR